MRRPFVALIVALVAIGALTGALAWLLDTRRPPPAASRAERLYLALCATCHGADGRGSWRALLFLVRPSDLSDARRLAGESDQYLSDIITHGGAPFGRPGMPAFGTSLDDADIEALVGYIRSLSMRTRRSSSSLRRTPSRTRSPGATPLASIIAGAPKTAITSIGPMPRLPIASCRTSSMLAAGRATICPFTS